MVFTEYYSVSTLNQFTVFFHIVRLAALLPVGDVVVAAAQTAEQQNEQHQDDEDRVDYVWPGRRKRERKEAESSISFSLMASHWLAQL